MRQNEEKKNHISLHKKYQNLFLKAEVSSESEQPTLIHQTNNDLDELLDVEDKFIFRLLSSHMGIFTHIYTLSYEYFLSETPDFPLYRKDTDYYVTQVW